MVAITDPVERRRREAAVATEIGDGRFDFAHLSGLQSRMNVTRSPDSTPCPVAHTQMCCHGIGSPLDTSRRIAVGRGRAGATPPA